MSDNWKLQVSPKLPDGTLINLRAETPEEFDQVVNWATTNAAKFVDVVTAINAVNRVAPLAGNVTTTQVQDAPAQAVGGWQNQQQAPPSYAQPAAGPGPACKHGQMIARQSKPGAPKQWSGHFCPTPQGTPDQCPPQFAKR